MNKSELIEAIAAKTGQKKSAVAEVIESLPGIIAKPLKKGEKVAIFGLGTFDLRKRAARKGRNPATGEEIKIKATRSPSFKAAKAFKDLV